MSNNSVVYHVYAEVLNGDHLVSMFDGVLSRGQYIQGTEDYSEIKNDIADHCNAPQAASVVILSLSLIKPSDSL